MNNSFDTGDEYTVNPQLARRFWYWDDIAFWYGDGAYRELGTERT